MMTTDLPKAYHICLVVNRSQSSCGSLHTLGARVVQTRLLLAAELFLLGVDKFPHLLEGDSRGATGRWLRAPSCV